MNPADLVPLGYAAIAAGFGYVATLVLRRYEVIRSIAVDIDSELREAFNESLRDDLESSDLLNSVDGHLVRAELRTAALPPRARARVEGQLRVASTVVMHLFSLSHNPSAIPQAHLQAAVAAVREVVGPLLLPPPLFHRRAGRPRAYPDPERFAALLVRNGSPEAALNQALGPYLEGLPEAFEDHYGRRE